MLPITNPSGVGCPRCTRSGAVEELGTASGSVWLHCRTCGHLWRRLDPQTDPFSLILTSRSVHPQPIAEATSQTFVARASRFSVQLEMRYRTAVDRQWRPGQTRNVSRSGILFHADAPIPPETEVELELVIPGTVAGEPPSRLCCAGNTVRMTDDASPSVAATVDEYRLGVL